MRAPLPTCRVRYARCVGVQPSLRARLQPNACHVRTADLGQRQVHAPWQVRVVEVRLEDIELLLQELRRPADGAHGTDAARVGDRRSQLRSSLRMWVRMRCGSTQCWCSVVAGRPRPRRHTVGSPPAPAGRGGRTATFMPASMTGCLICRSSVSGVEKCCPRAAIVQRGGAADGVVAIWLVGTRAHSSSNRNLCSVPGIF